MRNLVVSPGVRRFAASLTFLVLIQVWASQAYASSGESDASEIFFSIAYVFGSLFAIVYKIGVRIIRQLTGKKFRWRALFFPILWANIISVPLVFVVMPKFGRPTGHFFTDAIYAYLTTYAFIDMTRDFFEIRDLIGAQSAHAITQDVARQNGNKGV